MRDRRRGRSDSCAPGCAFFQLSWSWEMCQAPGGPIPRGSSSSLPTVLSPFYNRHFVLSCSSSIIPRPCSVFRASQGLPRPRGLLSPAGACHHPSQKYPQSWGLAVCTPSQDQPLPNPFQVTLQGRADAHGKHWKERKKPAGLVSPRGPPLLPRMPTHSLWSFPFRDLKPENILLDDYGKWEGPFPTAAEVSVGTQREQRAPRRRRRRPLGPGRALGKKRGGEPLPLSLRPGTWGAQWACIKPPQCEAGWD